MSTAEHEFIATADDRADKLHDALGEFVDDIESGEADAEQYHRLERNAIETLIAVRDAATTAAAIDDERPRLRASEELLRAAHAVDGDAPDVATDRIDDARDAIEQ